jgi:hypothetical protein
MTRPALLVTLALVLPAAGFAHKPSDSFLTLDAGGASGRWDIALQDLEHAVGLDADLDGAITWGELRARHAAVAEYALARLEVSRGTAACALTPTEQLVDRHSDGAYSVLLFDVDCPAGGEPLRVAYRLFFDLDPTHRGLLQISPQAPQGALQVAGPGQAQTAVLSPERPTFELAPQGRGVWPTFADYWREGVWHIWIGFDHVLFLLTLLLPAVMCRRGRDWRAVERPGPAVSEVVRIVTAFTVAHSLTLAVAVLGWVALPSRWVESAIAATVLLAAAHNLRPFLPLKGWLVAFVLGLIHGFGFAGVLADLGLPARSLAVALLGFNAGVEAGQLAIVALFLPAAFVLRESWFYRRAVLGAGSFAVLVIAAAWLVERGLDLDFMPI